MTRRIKSLKYNLPEGGFVHREHRSVKGRSPLREDLKYRDIKNKIQELRIRERELEYE